MSRGSYASPHRAGGPILGDSKDQSASFRRPPDPAARTPASAHPSRELRATEHVRPEDAMLALMRHVLPARLNADRRTRTAQIPALSPAVVQARASVVAVVDPGRYPAGPPPRSRGSTRRNQGSGAPPSARPRRSWRRGRSSGLDGCSWPTPAVPRDAGCGRLLIHARASPPLMTRARADDARPPETGARECRHLFVRRRIRVPPRSWMSEKRWQDVAIHPDRGGLTRVGT